jgi:shikimate dehydrogenase
MTIKAGVVGWPIGHSLSPVLHGHWLNEYGIDGTYEKIAAKPEELSVVIADLQNRGYAGVNVTVPHKEAAYALANYHDEAAELAGAANLLIFHEDGKIEGRNTDAAGFEQSVRESVGPLEGKTAVLIGAGGATRGAVLALDKLGAATVHVLARNREQANTLVSSMADKVGSALAPGDLKDWPRIVRDADFVANTSSGGMTGKSLLEVDPTPIKYGTPVLDVVYSPIDTYLLKTARDQGSPAIDGLGMLMHQAAPSFEAFFGVRPKVTQALREALIKVLSARS